MIIICKAKRCQSNTRQGKEFDTGELATTRIAESHNVCVCVCVTRKKFTVKSDEKKEGKGKLKGEKV